MLHKNREIILPETLSLLKDLQEDEMLADFFLVGGTALALQIGHRFSVDLDLFTLHSFDNQVLSEHLVRSYGAQISAVSRNTVLAVIRGVKVDLITHAYPLAGGLLEEEGLRLASMEDIGAMKLKAIAHSGQRLKDFIDVYFILERLPLEKVLGAYEKKYPHANLMIPIKGLTYFEDIDLEADPPMMGKKVSLKTLKARLVAAVEEPGRVFGSE